MRSDLATHEVAHLVPPTRRPLIDPGRNREARIDVVVRCRARS